MLHPVMLRSMKDPKNALALPSFQHCTPRSQPKRGVLRRSMPGGRLEWGLRSPLDFISPPDDASASGGDVGTCPAGYIGLRQTAAPDDEGHFVAARRVTSQAWSR